MIHETLANKSEQEIQISVSKWRKSVEARTKEQQDEITKKRLATLNARSIEEKLATKKKLKNTISNRSKERKEEIGKKHRDALKNIMNSIQNKQRSIVNECQAKEIHHMERNGW